MKLILTKTDILNLINEKFSLNLGINELEIQNTGTPYELALRQAMKEFPNMGHQKISAIKRFRELLSGQKVGSTNYPAGGIGLAEAKYAVENVETAIAEYNNTGKVPERN